MGLDMYLSVRKYVSRVDFSEDYDKSTGYRDTAEFASLVETAGMSEFLEPQDTVGATIEVPVMYWRKANAIHNWFIETRADGEDNCQPIWVNSEHLEELLDLCNKALSDRESAAEYLPTEGGFFFGGTEYDEYYFQHLEYTQERLTELIPLMKRKNDKGFAENDSAVYQASW